MLKKVQLEIAKVLKGASNIDETAVVIHIHGGGFMSMTSLTHKTYLEQWTKNLKMVHFCIDYRLSPENKYPDALDDVWQSYLWISNYAQYILGSLFIAQMTLTYL